MKNYNELISIIIPIYGVEKYIDKCILSVINQTYKNLEIILVDDGSPDNCPAICDQYAKKDSRIRVIHKINGGLSSARNSGIDIATGKYITFVDSDDSI
ncbi:MAG: glycosyltransferase, partial [bacterium]|nr:glycosyltransferase [bacterium]